SGIPLPVYAGDYRPYARPLRSRRIRGRFWRSPADSACLPNGCCSGARKEGRSGPAHARPLLGRAQGTHRSPMGCDRAWGLILVLGLIAWSEKEWRATTRRSALLLKTNAFVPILIALAQPRMTFFGTKVAVAVLADTSRSLTETDLERASGLATAIER